MKEFQFKRATAARWASQNPILKKGEPGLEVETGSLNFKMKFGDGVSNWNSLPYFANPHAQKHSVISASDHDSATESDYNKLVATNAATGAIEYIDKPTALTPADQILNWDGAKYIPHTAKKATDPGYAYLYTNVAALNWPTYLNRVCIDAIVYATMLISGSDTANAGMQSKLIGLSDVYNGYYNYFILATNDNINKLLAYADVNGTTSQSNPILVGDNSTYHGRKSEHLIIDPANQRLNINMAKTLFNRGTASKWLALDVNKEVVYMDAPESFNSWDVKVDLSEALAIHKTGSALGYKGVKFISGDGIAILSSSGADGFLVLTFSGPGTLSGVSSFNARTGAVLLSKADIEAVLTGLITTHTHNYDNYANWKIAWFNIGTDGTDYFNINSANSVEFLGGENISIPTPTVSGGKTTVTINSTAQSTLASFYADAANVSTAETNAYSYTLPANKLKANGSRLELYYDGIYAGNTNLKHIRIYFGTTLICSVLNIAYTNGAGWRFIIRVVRTSTTTIRVSADMFYGGQSWTFSIDHGSQNFTSTNIIKITLQSAVASNDLIAKTGAITFNP
jgi:hypothetical protein